MGFPYFSTDRLGYNIMGYWFELRYKVLLIFEQCPV